ncbi:MAG: tRNA (adenosine(37)-N6)-threonylcarbamoyltransferase complex transferase subunit TsaD [Candidatus Schekmanbacteria bacterium RBG_13_48_7]|uniref:tRNA N6-adenosine threonylcarbamoyltransferase n=1 Tax=Candidatus Schekmanbacteria bacterium RBG_13_48_7 TaxID=1817878 RepID=A0A1F7S0L7_9BACT|nr:MAG: tRNA (adenosine(37)-N6)-threonylcarbamoyltransferase complex transferase subunit TsaD [Candidatus Schekmanbacteria bacterium RBG_13_48_7]
MIILGIDTSCDDTSVSVVEDGKNILSNIVSSQILFHEKYGGVVPEIAARKHLELINFAIQEALETASVSWKDLHAVAVTDRPGLIGSLVVGVAAAKSIAWAHQKPLIPVNHIQAHLYAPQLNNEWKIDRFVALIVSGGHTLLAEITKRIEMEVIGRTVDDAAGEAFDKIAKLMNIGYPGGPAIQKCAEKCLKNPVQLPRPMIKEGYNFSFSGLKTAAKLVYEQIISNQSEYTLPDLAAGFQDAVVDVLQHKTFKLAQETGLKNIVVTGGVAANKKLREVFHSDAIKKDINVYFPTPELCTDNAAMVAGIAYHLYKADVTASWDLNPQSAILRKGV